MIDPEDLLKDEIVFQVAKIVAEEDSIGEGYGYCENYELARFKGNCDYKRVAIDIVNKILDELGFNTRRQYSPTLSAEAGDLFRNFILNGYELEVTPENQFLCREIVDAGGAYYKTCNTIVSY